MPYRLSLFCLLAFAAPLFAAVTLISANAHGEAGDGFSRAPALSRDGRLVAFMSDATNLIEGDTNGKTDIFLCDRNAQAITRISQGLHGEEANGNSTAPAISADGRFIAFLSAASNLVPDDTNKAADVFVYDRQAGTTTRASVSSGGAQAGAASSPPVISADGRFVAFRSEASNLVRNDANGFADIFRHDCRTGETIRASVNGKGEEADGPSDGLPTIGGDGRYVAFASRATNLSPDDGNGITQDVFLRDCEAGSTACISRPTGGKSVSGESISPFTSTDGRSVAFISFAEYLLPGDTNHAADIYRYDRTVEKLARISAGNDASLAVSLSADGLRAAFLSHATDLAPADKNDFPDIFLLDVNTRTTTRINISPQGVEADDDSSAPIISGDGSTVAFVSWSSVLMPGERFSKGDVFVWSAGVPARE